jgi:hypothetical protein
MRRGMPEDGQGFGILFRQDAKAAALPEWGRQVLDLSVDLHGDCCLEQSLTYGAYDFGWKGSVGYRTL